MGSEVDQKPLARKDDSSDENTNAQQCFER